MRLVRFLFSVFFVVFLNMDVRCMGDTLKFIINQKVISIRKGDKELKLTGTLTNSSKINLILYAFRKTIVLDSSLDSIFFNDIIKNGSAGNVLILLDKNGNRKEIHPEVCFDCGKHNPEDFHNPDYLSIANQRAKNIYAETAEVLNARRTNTVTLVTSLEDIDLRKGEYRIYMIYYCGSEIHDVVDKETAGKDEIKFKAQLLRGWIKSDTVKLIVE